MYIYIYGYCRLHFSPISRPSTAPRMGPKLHQTAGCIPAGPRPCACTRLCKNRRYRWRLRIICWWPAAAFALKWTRWFLSLGQIWSTLATTKFIQTFWFIRWVKTCKNMVIRSINTMLVLKGWAPTAMVPAGSARHRWPSTCWAMWMPNRATCGGPQLGIPLKPGWTRERLGP